MRVSEAIEYCYKVLKSSKIPNAKLDSEIFVSSLVHLERLEILSNLNNSFENSLKVKLDKLIARRIKREPVSYILQKKEFWKSDFFVDQSVLIPRPETEVLMEMILKKIKNKNKFFDILDIGTGSGCIIISLLEELKKAKGYGVDISKKAIDISNRNRRSHNLSSRLKLIKSDFRSQSFDKIFDIIVSNPPYIPYYQLKNLSSEIRLYEPKTALNGGIEGFDILKKVILFSKKKLKKKGLLALEIGNNQFENIKKILARNSFLIVDTFKNIDQDVRCLMSMKL